MPNRVATARDTEPVTFSPFGAGGVDFFTAPALVPPEMLSEGYNLRSSDLGLSRRPGAAKVAQLTSGGASKTFGADTKYATITAASQLLIPRGGWALRVSFTAVRPSAGNTAYILSSKPSGAAYNVMQLTLSDAGVPAFSWRDSSGNTWTVTGSARTAGMPTHALALYDAPSGTFNLYINGVAVGTPITNMGALVQPSQTPTDWFIGVEKETGGAVTANTHFDGAVDGLTLFSLAGTRPASGTPSLASVLVKHSFRQWPCPQMESVLFNYDMDGSGLSSLPDTSRFGNDATVTGVITSTSEVAYASLVGQYLGTYEGAGSVDLDMGAAYNLAAANGTLYYETVRRAV